MLESLRRFSALERSAQMLFLRAMAMLPLVSMGCDSVVSARRGQRFRRLFRCPFPN
jgi:hypothetical protein